MGLGRAHKRMQDNMTATRGNERRQAWPAGIKELVKWPQTARDWVNLEKYGRGLCPAVGLERLTM